MDFREPLLGGGADNSCSTSSRIIRKKSDHPILSLISPRRIPSPRSTDPFAYSLFDQGRGGPEFQVGSIPKSRFATPDATPPSPAASSFLGNGSFLAPDLSGVVGTLPRIPELLNRVFPEQPSSSAAEGTTTTTVAVQEQEQGQGNEPDLEAWRSIDENYAYFDDDNSGNDSNRGVFGEALTDDAQERKEENEKDKEDKSSWRSGLAGLLLSVPLLPSLPDVLNPFSESPDDDDDEYIQYTRCDSCKQPHPVSADNAAAEEEQDAQTSPRRSGGIRELFYSSLPASFHSLPDLMKDPSLEQSNNSLDSTGVSQQRVKVVSVKEDAEAQYANGAVSSEPCNNLQHYVRKKVYRRCKTAPLLTGVVNLQSKKSQANIRSGAHMKRTASSVVWQATVGLFIYLSIGVIIYTWKRDEFHGIETVGVVDALYFCIVTMCTIGYGDITPITPSAKILACALVFVGFAFIDAVMSGMVTFVLDRQEHLLLTAIEDGHHEMAKNIVMDTKKGRMRIRTKVALAVGTVLCAMAIGVCVLHYMEELSWIDAIYATCISITTVGYGDVSFQTTAGRLFAAVWLLFSTLGVARAFLFLAEARVHSRHRRLAKRVLRRKLTTNDLMAMDLDNDGHVSKAEFVVYKLKEMGKIDESDVLEICKQFEYIDNMNAGKITLAQLLEDSVGNAIIIRKE
ncbi:unnamed protein product [Calypogeia fissa]